MGVAQKIKNMPKAALDKAAEVIGNAAAATGQYIKDVVTLKKFGENFLKGGEAFDNWFAHGANEAANMVLHGQPAPIYSRSVSPDMSQESVVEASLVEPAQEASMSVEPVQSESALDKAIEMAQNAPEPEVEMEVEQ